MCPLKMPLQGRAEPHLIHGSLDTHESVVHMTYNVLHDTVPRYFGPLNRVADLPGRRALRSASASTSCLVVPSFRLSTIGRRTFNVSAPQI